jgi:hypothetical protein
LLVKLGYTYILLRGMKGVKIKLIKIVLKQIYDTGTGAVLEFVWSFLSFQTKTGIHFKKSNDLLAVYTSSLTIRCKSLSITRGCNCWNKFNLCLIISSVLGKKNFSHFFHCSYHETFPRFINHHIKEINKPICLIHALITEHSKHNYRKYL